MNLIVTEVEDGSIAVNELRKRNCAVDVLPSETLLNVLTGQQGSSLIADAVVAFIDAESLLSSPPSLPQGSVSPEVFVRELRRLPDGCAMLDGRKWKAIPFIIVLTGTEAALARDLIHIPAVSEAIVFVGAAINFGPTYDVILDAVRDYRQRILAEFSNLGFLVSYQNGRYRVGPAMSAVGDLEGYLYFGRADKRSLRGKFFTVDRDSYGIEYEIELFEALINEPETDERQLQKFFEEHPHFLADARQSLAMPHVRLKNSEGRLFIPDFVIKPIVAYQRDSLWQVLDLKKPNARLLAGNRRHVRLSHEVVQAMSQLRNYGDYFKSSENTKIVISALGHGLKYPKLAVLIGRLRDSLVEELEKAQSREPDVQIVTYDEILQRQKLLVR